MWRRKGKEERPEVESLEVAGRRVGVVGLEKVLEEVHALGVTDAAALDRELLARFRRRNFVPEAAARAYAAALRRAYARRYNLDLLEEEEVSAVALEIKVLGPGCARCHALEREVLNVLAELGVAADVEKVQDMDRIAQYGVFMTPGLVINGKVKAAGRVPNRAELKKLIQEETA